MHGRLLLHTGAPGVGVRRGRKGAGLACRSGVKLDTEDDSATTIEAVDAEDHASKTTRRITIKKRTTPTTAAVTTDTADDRSRRAFRVEAAVSVSAGGRPAGSLAYLVDRRRNREPAAAP
jgi:hypothetical protein